MIKLPNIREKEEELFENWMRKYPDQTFVIDGCIDPDSYSRANIKVVFLLKDENTGLQTSSNARPLRDELSISPHLWWNRVALWAFLINDPNLSWQDAVEETGNQSRIINALKPFCVINLKKTGGVGTVQDSTIAEYVQQDKQLILQQLSIYSPDVIVACGNGDQAIELFSDSCRHELPNGVGYWPIEISGERSFLIDYCHPSVRSGTKIKGVIAKGLANSIKHIISMQ